MRFLVLSDIHADANGLELVLTHAHEHAGAESWDDILLLGDLIGYGHEPLETLQLLAAANAHTAIRGNHEAMLAMLRSGRNLQAPEVMTSALEACLEQLSTDRLDWLESLPDQKTLPGLNLVHGSPNPARQFGYILSSTDARQAEPHMLDSLCLIGHSDLPGIFLKDSPDNSWETRPARRESHTWHLLTGAKAFLNPGTVAEPRPAGQPQLRPLGNGTRAGTHVHR